METKFRVFSSSEFVIARSGSRVFHYCEVKYVDVDERAPASCTEKELQEDGGWRYEDLVFTEGTLILRHLVKLISKILGHKN